MEQDIKRSPNSSQQTRAAASKEMNVWEYVRLLNNTCKSEFLTYNQQFIDLMYKT